MKKSVWGERFNVVLILSMALICLCANVSAHATLQDQEAFWNSIRVVPAAEGVGEANGGVFLSPGDTPSYSSVGAQGVGIDLRVPYYDTRNHPIDITNMQTIVHSLVFTQFNDYIKNVSLGKAWLVGEVTPWLVRTTPLAGESLYDRSLAIAYGYDFSRYNRNGFIASNRGLTNGGLGSGSLGAGSFTVCNLGCLVHEYGHSMGLYHSNGLVCTNYADWSSCTSYEYNGLGPMGGSSISPYNAAERLNLGWTTPEFVRTTGTYTLVWSSNRTTDRIGLKIPSLFRGDKPYAYYLEYYRPDSLHVLLEQKSYVPIAYVLDMKVPGGTGFNDPLSVGETYTDPVTGVSITFVSQTTSFTSATVRVTFPTDTQAPVISGIQPASGSTLAGIKEILPTVQDNVGIARIDYYVDDVLKTSIRPDFSYTTLPWYLYYPHKTYIPQNAGLVDLRGLNGQHTITVKAYDFAGNLAEASSIYTLIDDTTPPSITINSPQNNAVAPGSVDVSVSSTDNVEVVRTQYFIDGMLVQEAPYGSNQNINFFGGYASGSHKLTARTYDASNNSAEASVNITIVPWLAPRVSFIRPTPGQSVSAPFTVNVSAFDYDAVTKVEIHKDGTLIRTITAPPWSFTLDPTSDTTGQHRLTATAYNAGSSRSAETSYFVRSSDTTPPQVVIESPANGTQFYATPSTVTATVTVNPTDNTGVTNINLYLNDVSNGATTLAPILRYDMSVPTAPGTYTLVGTARDYAGNVGFSAPITIIRRPYLYRNVQVTKEGSGSGTVSSNPAETSSCGTLCFRYYESILGVTLNATPAAGSYVQWLQGCTSVNGNQCTIVFNASISPDSLTARVRFNPGSSLTVLKQGQGNGTITSSPAGINCGASCFGAFNVGTAVTLTATSNVESNFTGWSGDAVSCGTQTTCTVTLSSSKTIAATFNLLNPPKTLTVYVTGSGNVTSSPSGISCTYYCSRSFPHGTNVTLTATPAAGQQFTQWTGAAATCGTNPICTLTMNSNLYVNAYFRSVYPLTIVRTGSGNGTVTSSPNGIDCGIDCTEQYASGTSITLTATSAIGSVFTGWTSTDAEFNCSGTGTCGVSMDAARSVQAVFETALPALFTITRNGSGNGTITSIPAGISCGSTCSASFDSSTPVTLTATPATGSVFTGWSGDACAGSILLNCSLTVTSTTSIGATFENLSTLSLPTTGLIAHYTFDGSFADSSGNANDATPFGGVSLITVNGSDSAASFDGVDDYLAVDHDQSLAVSNGLSVSLWIKPRSSTNKGLLFKGPLTNSQGFFSLIQGGVYIFRLNGGADAYSTTAPAFTTWTHLVATYDGAMQRIYVDGVLQSSVSYTTPITTNIDPLYIGTYFSPFHIFDGLMNNVMLFNRSLTTTEILQLYHIPSPIIQTFVLSTNIAGNGAGTITSTPSGIDCGPACFASFNSGTLVTLSASPTTGSTFDGWTGDAASCGTQSTCTLTMNTSHNVGATFTYVPPIFTLTVARAGDGSGTVTSPAGIDCGEVCVAGFEEGTVIPLTATPAPGSIFVGWSGACSGTGTCSVTMDAARSVSASFMSTPSFVSPIPGLVARYTFDGSFLDSSGNNNHATPLNGAALVTLNGSDSAVEFDGVNDYLSVEHSPSLAVTNGLSISLWAQPRSGTNNGLVFKGPLTNSQGVWTTVMGSTYTFRLNGGNDVYSTSAPSYNAWTHIVATYGDGEQRIYIDGVLQGSVPYTAPLAANTDPFYIGVYYSPAYVFNGLMNNVMLFNRSLSQSEVTQLYTNPSLTAPAHPADVNTDLRISFLEFSDYNRAYKLQEVWSPPPSPPLISYYTRALLFYKRGSTYSYNQSATCPLCWVAV